MTRKVFFKIADHIVLVRVPLDFPLMCYLPSFTDFLLEESMLEIEPLLEINVSNSEVPKIEGDFTILADNSPVWGEGFCFGEYSTHYLTTMHVVKKGAKIGMVSSKDFKYSTIYLADVDESFREMIGWFFMVAFGQGVLPHNTIMIHASTVERNQDEAYAFLGKSGTGKSTHSQLWLRYLKGFSLLNDDNPVIRIFDDRQVFIYGTPWSGKTVCYRNLKVKLRGLIRLEQAAENNFVLKKNSESLIMLLPSCTAIRWNKMLFNSMVNTVEAIIGVIPVAMLDCLIDEAAVRVAYNGIKFKALNHE